MSWDSNDPLLPRPRSTSILNPNPIPTSSSSRGRSLQTLDFLNLKKLRGQGLRSWIRVDADTGSSTAIEADKLAIMRRCDLPARDLRLLDPLFVYPSAILGRERAIVVNLEQIRCVITADEVLILNSLEAAVVRQCVGELQRRVLAGAGGDGSAAADYLPFEFRALEVALEAACAFLDTQVRDEIEQLMDDEGDMAEMYLTGKKKRIGSSSPFSGEQSVLREYKK